VNLRRGVSERRKKLGGTCARPSKKTEQSRRKPIRDRRELDISPLLKDKFRSKREGKIEDGKLVFSVFIARWVHYRPAKKQDIPVWAYNVEIGEKRSNLWRKERGLDLF